MGASSIEEMPGILACPKCKADLRPEGETIVCASPSCGLRYPIRDGIPVLLIEEAEPPRATAAP